MMHVAELEIDRTAVESLPECLAREYCILPLGYKDGRLQLLFGQRESYQEDLDRFEFLLNCKVDCFVAERSRVETAIDEVYRLSTTLIENCGLEFQKACPKAWLELQPTMNGLIRFCSVCHRDVVFCATPNEALAQASAGHCIALYDPHPIETETIESFISYY